MATNLKYMPVLRVRQEEVKVLRSFDFSNRIYPCLEIYKEKEKENSKKSFEEFHIDLIKEIKADKAFVDLPVHMKQLRAMKTQVLSFLSTVVANREERTKYMIKLKPVANKIIPVISTYFTRTNEPGTIKLQEKELRKHFNSLAFRTFPDTFNNDFSQVQAVSRANDYLIIDLGDVLPHKEDDAFAPIFEKLGSFNKCTVVVLKSSINKITNVSLDHGKEVPSIDNSLIDLYQDYAGSAFADYAGIKKDNATEGGIISPGFLYYDAVKNSFFGYKGRKNKLDDFKDVIVPAVISSGATYRMMKSGKDYLTSDNVGWQLILAINSGRENGRSMAKFKNISMHHYLHCIKTRIEKGEFD
ncbi:MAG: hypothetical protein ICV66_06280 [Chitinophagaceae bacterium]|nr:hypothetical protein [Chitinophagaceae bacterium]